MRKVVVNKTALNGYVVYQTCPIGTVLDFAGVNIPNGFLPCDGRALSRTEYSELYGVIGTIYGNGDGSTTFNLPNCVEKVTEGASAGTIGKVYEAGLPNIKGTIGDGIEANVVPDVTGAFGITTSKKGGEGNGNYQYFGMSFDASKSNPIYSDDCNTVQMDAVGMFKIIKVKSYMIDAEQIENPVTMEVPVGTILASGMTSAPVGYLMCNGQAVSRNTYGDLFTAIGTIYGDGDGSTTFNLPDLRDKFPQGANGNLGNSIEAGLPNIKGKFIAQIPSGAQDLDIAKEGCFYNVTDSSYQFTVDSGTSSAKHKTGYGLDASLSNSIYSEDCDTVQPPSVTVNYIIKALKTTGQVSSDVELDDTKMTNANVWSAEKIVQYIVDQNELSDYEEVQQSEFGDTEQTAYIAEYDGFLYCSADNVSGGTRYFYATIKNTKGNEIHFNICTNGGTATSNIIPIEKGDKIWYRERSNAVSYYFRYYKKRDYSNRT